MRGIQELQDQVRAADQARIVAQREAHEAEIEMRKRQGIVTQHHRVFDPDDADGVAAIIEELEHQGIGQPSKPMASMHACKQGARQHNRCVTKSWYAGQMKLCLKRVWPLRLHCAELLCSALSYASKQCTPAFAP